MAIDLEAIKQRWRGLVDGVNFTGRFRIALSGAQSAQLATDFKALVAEVDRLRTAERELADLRAYIAAANPGDAIYRQGNEIRHSMSWSLLFLALELGLIDTESDDCPKPTEYGGGEELLKLVADEALRLKIAAEPGHVRDRWISATERLPAFRTSVLVSLRDATDADEESEELHGVLDEHGWQIVFRGPIGPPDVVTHWMPMIAPPSAEEKADETR